MPAEGEGSHKPASTKIVTRREFKSFLEVVAPFVTSENPVAPALAGTWTGCARFFPRYPPELPHNQGEGNRPDWSPCLLTPWITLPHDENMPTSAGKLESPSLTEDDR